MRNFFFFLEKKIFFVRKKFSGEKVFFVLKKNGKMFLGEKKIIFLKTFGFFLWAIFFLWAKIFFKKIFFVGDFFCVGRLLFFFNDD